MGAPTCDTKLTHSIPKVYVSGMTRLPVSNQQFVEEPTNTAFTEAWFKCIKEHNATLVSGPCYDCAIKAGQRLRDMSEDEEQ